MKNIKKKMYMKSPLKKILRKSCIQDYYQERHQKKDTTNENFVNEYRHKKRRTKEKMMMV